MRKLYLGTQPKKKIINRPNHWSSEFNHYLVKNQFLIEKDANLLTSESGRLDVPTQIWKDKISEWQKTQIGFGESTNNDDALGVNKYLSRVIYEEMFQISKPDNSGIMSTGGVITHIDANTTPSIDDWKYIRYSIQCSKTVRAELTTELNQKLSVASKDKITIALGVDVDKQPLTAEENFINA